MGRPFSSTVTNVVARTESAADDVNPAWSRNGLRIAFSSTRDDAQGDIYTVRLQDGMVNVDLKRVTKDVGYLDAYPAWSPDSLSLAFVSTRPDPGGSSAQDREIWIEDVNVSSDVWVFNAPGTT